MKLTSVSHVGVRTRDRARSEAFYVDLLGLRPHPSKANWLATGDGTYGIHLMPAGAGSHDGKDVADCARHVALATGDLEGVVDELLAAGYEPFQGDLNDSRRALTDSTDLGFGIGTVLVLDPDGNVVEFVDRNRGIFLDVLGPESAEESDHE
jgi:catechol 2,3-dioxygenase-like lactoylglutathione lyase family enzyme